MEYAEDSFEKLRDDLAEIGRKIDAEPQLLSPRAIQDRFVPRILAFGCSRLRANAPDPATHDQEMARPILDAAILEIAKDCGPKESLERLPLTPRDADSATKDAFNELYSRSYGIIERAMPYEYHLLFRGSEWLISQMKRAMTGEMNALILFYPIELGDEQSRPLPRVDASRHHDAKAIIERALATSNPLQAIDRSLEAVDWNRNTWAAAVGLHRTTPYRWFKTGKCRPDSRRQLTKALDKWIAENPRLT
jgi:hypothetical protein